MGRMIAGLLCALAGCAHAPSLGELTGRDVPGCAQILWHDRGASVTCFKTVGCKTRPDSLECVSDDEIIERVNQQAMEDAL